MLSADQAGFFADLMTQVQAEKGEVPTVTAIIDHTIEVVPAAHHVSLTVRRRGGRFATLGASSEKAQHLDELQYELKEGPCVEALVDADWYRSGDVGNDPRWPTWGPRAAAAGALSLFSVPLLARGERVGALNMYAEEHGGFDDRHVIDMAHLYAVHAAYALASARQVSGLETAMESRHVIGVAQGILIERFGLTRASSFSLLQRISSTQNRPLREVAHELCDTGRISGIEEHGSTRT